MTESSLRLYHAALEPEVRRFYEETWKTTEGTRESFEDIGIKLTDYTLANVPLLTGEQGITSIYAAPVARAGVGLFRTNVIQELRKRSQDLGVEFHSFGIGASRPHERTDELPAKVYWNTLRHSNPDLSSAILLLYEFGEATGCTIEGVVNELLGFGLNPENLILLAGAVCLDQSDSRLGRVAPGMHVVYGSRWRYIEEPDSTQFYLNSMRNNNQWNPMNPRDWGRCVSGMDDEDSVLRFISWIGKTVDISPEDQRMLYEKWLDKIDEEKK